MKVSGLSRYSLCLSIGIAMLAGCGGSQLPIGAAPQTSALVARATSSNYKILHSFGAYLDGNDPASSLVDADGTLYGTTAWGGVPSYALGTVFSITPGGNEKVIYRFGRVPDGNIPEAGLIGVGGTFYGTTSSGGRFAPLCTRSYYPCGTVFSITPSGTEKVLHSFGNKKDGFDPVAPLVEVKGKLYGTTEFGGAYFNGTVFSITLSGKEKVLHSFGSGSDGLGPVAPLIAVKGTLYGTTCNGGAHQLGTVFSITPGGTEKVLHSFGSGTDGACPSAGLIDVGGTLYGTTEVGGNRIDSHDCNQTALCGTVFSMTPSGKEKVLHRFVGKKTDGAAPVASLIELKGTLYGTTEYGGPYYCSGGSCGGTVFSITPSGKEKVLHSFSSGTDGKYPTAALIHVDGTLYGTTLGGGRYSHGTVFALKP